MADEKEGIGRSLGLIVITAVISIIGSLSLSWFQGQNKNDQVLLEMKADMKVLSVSIEHVVDLVSMNSTYTEKMENFVQNNKSEVQRLNGAIANLKQRQDDMKERNQKEFEDVRRRLSKVEERR